MDQIFSHSTSSFSYFTDYHVIISIIIIIINVFSKQMQMAVQYYVFERHRISEYEVFYTTQLSFAFVNNRPASPGMVLMIVFSFDLIIQKRFI